MTAFAYRMQRMGRSMERALANATARWDGGQAFGVLLDTALEESFMGGEVATAVRQTVSLCVGNTPGIAESSRALSVNGQAVQILGPVVPDAGGWASFPVLFLGADDAGY